MKLSYSQDSWERIGSSTYPVCMYGMGNGADKIIEVLERKGISVSDFFASNGFVRGHSFRGKKVLSYSEAKEKHGRMTAVLAFGSQLPDVHSAFRIIMSEQLFIVPFVPVSGEGLFDKDFLENNADKIDEVYEMLSDERSKNVFRDVIEFNFSGDASFLFSGSAGTDDVFGGILDPSCYRNAADLGAYTGDTASVLGDASPLLDTVIAVEPDEKNFRKLSLMAESYDGPGRIVPVCAAAGKENGTASFLQTGNRNSSLSEQGNREVVTVSVDEISDGMKLDLIKYDVEGAEREAILGSEKQIRGNAPDLIVSVYHRREDIFSIPLMLKKIQPKYSLYLRRKMYVPAWDVQLIATANCRRL